MTLRTEAPCCEGRFQVGGPFPTLEMTDLDHGVAVQVGIEGQSLGVL